jgi:hypothetical protein
VVRCTFSPARAWRPAIGARLARTLGVTLLLHTSFLRILRISGIRMQPFGTTADLSMSPSPIAIVTPMLFPVLCLAVTELHLFFGGLLGAHGPSIYFLLMASLLGVVVIPWELFACLSGSLQLRTHRRLRTRVNVLSLLAAGSYVLASLIYASQFTSSA